MLFTLPDLLDLLEACPCEKRREPLKEMVAPKHGTV
jgi:hypothetical protein